MLKVNGKLCWILELYIWEERGDVLAFKKLNAEDVVKSDSGLFQHRVLSSVGEVCVTCYHNAKKETNKTWQWKHK